MRIFAAAIVVLLFASCGIQHLRIEKRHYRSGFYFGGVSTRSNLDTTHTRITGANIHPSQMDPAQHNEAVAWQSTDTLIKQSQQGEPRVTENVIAENRFVADLPHTTSTRTSTAVVPAVEQSHSPKNGSWKNVLGLFLLLIICAVAPCSVVGVLGFMGFYSDSKTLEKLAAPLLILGMLMLVAEIVAIVLFFSVNPLWLPIYRVLAGLGISCAPFLAYHINR